jgi:Fur family transcriptional regulator, ferric uptake regulator
MENVRTEVRALLRGKKMRATAIRIAVLVTLHESQIPMTHEQVIELLPSGAFDKASVWRVLSDLAETGILRRMDLGDRIWRYELYDACRAITNDHPHFLCETCGVVRCLPPLDVRARDGAIPEVLLHAEFSIRVTGQCAQCLAA